MSDETSVTPEASPGARMVRRGSLAFVRRPYPSESDAERLLFVGAHWESGAEVILRLFDADEIDYFTPGPHDEREHGPAWQLIEDAGAFLFDPDAKDPPNRIGYTSSPASYDHGCTVELERFHCPAYASDRETVWRKVLVRGGSGFADGQIRRYFVFTETDPRVVQAEYARKRDAAAAEEAERARLAAEDNTVLAALPLLELREEHDRRSKAVWAEPGDEQHLRLARSKAMLARKEQEALDAEWAALVARIPSGVTLLIPGCPPIPRTDPWAIRYIGKEEPAVAPYLIHIEGVALCSPTMPIDKRLCMTRLDGMNHTSHIEAVTVADWVAKGYVTDAYPSIELRAKFYARFGRSLIDAPRAVVAGKMYFVAYPRFSGDIVIVEAATMNLCRSQKTRDLITEVHRWHERVRWTRDAIAYREGLPEDDSKRELLPKLRAQLEEIGGAEPHKNRVTYTVPALPMRTVEEVLAERRSKGDES